MRLIIIPEDKFVSIDDEGIHGVDMTWIPEFTGESGISTSVHAVQWYGDHGEIELVTRDSNIEITELGVFEQAASMHAERKAAIEAEEEAAKAAAAGTTIDIDAILSELESEENANVGVATT